MSRSFKKLKIALVASLVTIALVGGGLYFSETGPVYGAWDDNSEHNLNDWDHRFKITSDNTQVDAGYPYGLIFDLANAPAGFWDHVNSDGGDIRMTKADGETELARGVREIDTTAETGLVYFHADGIATSTDTDFYLYYGNSEAGDHADSDPYGMENVFSANHVFYSTKEKQDGSIKDETGNHNDGTIYGATAATGKVGGALEYDGVDDHVEVTNFTETDTGVAFWVKENGEWKHLVRSGETKYIDGVEQDWENKYYQITNDTLDLGRTGAKEFTYQGGSSTKDVSDFNEITVKIYGAGGVTPKENPPGDLAYEDAKGGNGGYIEAVLNVSEINYIDIYVGGTGGAAIGEDAWIAGWGWEIGGKGMESDYSPGGAGGSASAILVNGNPVLVADGGGGGFSWDTYTFGSGGGGARGGLSLENDWGDSAEDGDGDGFGGDGGTGTEHGDLDSIISAEDGGAEVVDNSIVDSHIITKGGGSHEDKHGKVIIELANTIYHEGIIDDFHINSSTLSPDEISTIYHNQSDPASFWTVGSLEDQDGWLPTVYTIGQEDCDGKSCHYATVQAWWDDVHDSENPAQWGEVYSGGAVGGWDQNEMLNASPSSDSYPRLYAASGHTHTGRIPEDTDEVAQMGRVILTTPYTRVNRLTLYQTDGTEPLLEVASSTENYRLDSLLALDLDTGSTGTGWAANFNAPGGTIQNLLGYWSQTTDTTDIGISLDTDTASGLTIYNSTFLLLGNTGEAMAVSGDNGLTLKNTFGHTAGSQFFLGGTGNWAASIDASYNAVTDSSSNSDILGSNSLTGLALAEQFVSPSTNWFPKAGADIINAGTDVGLNYDSAGTTRPRMGGFDIGALEWIESKVRVKGGSTIRGGSHFR